MIRERTKIKYTGMRYNRMTILAVSRRDPKNRHHYFVSCRCDCGVVKEVRLSGLQTGSTKSCGCYGAENWGKIHKGNTYARKAFGEHAKNTLYRNYIRYAKERDIPFNLSLAELVSITEQNCFYCDATPAFIKAPKNSHGAHIYNGVDRADNEIGYTVDNCVPACRPCNTAKNAVTRTMIFKLYHRLFPHKSDAPLVDV